MADDRKNGGPKAATADMTPAPTQEQLDEHAGETGKKEKAEREKVAASRKQEDLTPTPTQAEANEQRAKAFGTTVEEDHKRRKEYVEAHTPNVSLRATPEEMIPTPTQAECDQAKTDTMYQPEGAGDPQKIETSRASPQHRRMEAERPGGYQTRAVAAEPVKAE